MLVHGVARGRMLAARLKERWECVVEEESDDLRHCRCSLGGRGVTVHGTEDDVMHLLAGGRRLAGARFDAAVFLADHTSPDPDAQNLLWLFKMMEMMDGGKFAAGPHFHVLAEILSSAKGELVERRAATAGGRRVRALSTQKLRTYFMAHCAFTPGLDRVYDELVTSAGVELCQVVPSGLAGVTTFSRLLDELAAKRMILFGVGYRGEGGARPLVINPPPGGADEAVDMGRVKHLYVIADTGGLRGA